MPLMPYELIPASGSDQAEEWVRLGLEAQSTNRFPDAERCYRHALRLDPRHAVATQNLAVLFVQINNLPEALLTIERAAIFDGVQPAIHTNRAVLLMDVERVEEALASARHAVKLSDNRADKSGYVSSRLALALMSASAGLPEQAIPLYREILAKEPAHPAAGPNICFVQTLTDATPAELATERRAWHVANKYTGPILRHENTRVPDRVLRVGYVGGDFKQHSASMIFANVVLEHDPAAVEVYLYSSIAVDPVADHMTKRYADKAGPRWRDISAMSDADAAVLVRSDRIDILVDLAGHTNGGRLPLFTRRLAPVQVTAWGFAHGTGCAEIDYFFADPVAVLPADRPHYAEKIFDLPCIVTYREPTEYNLKGTSALPYHVRDYLTFGAYARYEKFSAACLATFAEILRRVPGSKLEFKDRSFRRPYSIRRVLAAMPDIDPARLLFSIDTNHSDHLLSYQQVDLILNPFPHSGGLVSAEQVFMGVPYITLYGTQPAGRTGASILTAMGRTEWIAKTPAEYVEKAVALAGDIPTLAKVRKTLRAEFMGSPVVKGYREAVESAYRTMWTTWCAS